MAVMIPGRLLRSLQRRMATLVGRAVLLAVNAGTGLQSVQVRILADEVMDGVEHMEPYGFTSNPLPGAEGVVLNVAGQRGACVGVNFGNRGVRVAGLKSGEVCIYTDEGDKNHPQTGPACGDRDPAPCHPGTGRRARGDEKLRCQGHAGRHL